MDGRAWPSWSATCRTETRLIEDGHRRHVPRGQPSPDQDASPEGRERRQGPVAARRPASREVARRSEEEGIGKGTLGAKIRNALAVYKPLTEVPGGDPSSRHDALQLDLQVR